MADVKWIKIVTGIFDDEKIQLIEQMPDSDTVLVIWFKLLCLAGKTNNNGIIMLSDKIAYTDEMLAAIFRRPINTVRLALKTFEMYGMVELVDGVVTISNWEKHQNIEGMDRIREQTKKRVQKHREKAKELPCNDTVTLRNATEEEREEDKERDKRDKECDGKAASHTPKTDYDFYVSSYNSISTNLPKCRMLTEKRKKAIRSFEKQLGKEQFSEVCQKVNASSFCTGGNERGWKADFDFLIRPDKAASILEGKYDGKEKGFEYSYDFEPGTSL